jgi:hypothetical protein
VGHGTDENSYSTLVGKPEGKISLGRPRQRWEDNIRIEIINIRNRGRVVDWMHPSQDRYQ